MVELVLRLARLGQPDPAPARALQPAEPDPALPPGQPWGQGLVAPAGAARPHWRRSEFARAGADVCVAALRAQHGKAGEDEMGRGHVDPKFWHAPVPRSSHYVLVDGHTHTPTAGQAS